MGEAKRRRERGTVPCVDCVDAVTGEAKQVRLAGDFTEWRKRYGAAAVRVQAGEQIGCAVPCNGCTACCYKTVVEIDLARERPENLAVLDVVPNPGGDGMMLRKKPDGACVHLGPSGCTVYEHRPIVCRSFDCRVYGVIGLGVKTDNRHPLPAWAFDEPRTKSERVYLIAHRLAALAYVLTHPEGWNVDDALIAAAAGARAEKRTAEMVVDLLDKQPREQRKIRYHSGVSGLDFLRLAPPKEGG